MSQYRAITICSTTCNRVTSLPNRISPQSTTHLVRSFSSPLFSSRRFAGTFSASLGYVSTQYPGVHHEKPDQPPSKLKDPTVPDGHPIDTDGRPLGHIIPDYDIELPVRSFGGYAKDFEAWTEPPTFPPTSWPEIARYDYEELEIENFPPIYELNLAYAMNALCLCMIIIPIAATKWELDQYYKAHGDFYATGWPHFHYEPSLDIVPLTVRDDGLPPESLILKVDNDAMVRHELEKGNETSEEEATE